MRDEGNGGGLEDLLVDNEGTVGLVAALVVRGSDDGRGDQGQGGEEGGGDAHGEMGVGCGVGGGIRKESREKREKKRKRVFLLYLVLRNLKLRLESGPRFSRFSTCPWFHALSMREKVHSFREESAHIKERVRATELVRTKK